MTGLTSTPFNLGILIFVPGLKDLKTSKLHVQGGMGNLLQETQIKLRRDLVMLRLRYYTSLRKLQADADREQWSRYKYEMRKEQLAALETNIARIQRVLG